MGKSKLNKKQALKLLAEYETERVTRILAESLITDVKPDWVIPYGILNEDDYWYCFPKESHSKIGQSRVIIISKLTGKVVYDAYSGE